MCVEWVNNICQSRSFKEEVKGVTIAIEAGRKLWDVAGSKQELPRHATMLASGLLY